jgi:glycogen synthase
MKLLAIIDSYPPHHSGGYELRCRDVLDRLAMRGHDIVVITTFYMKCTDTDKSKRQRIHRVLHTKANAASIWKRILNDARDMRSINRITQAFKPDIAYLWHVVNLSDAIIPYFCDRQIPIVFDEGGTGLIHFTKVMKR